MDHSPDVASLASAFLEGLTAPQREAVLAAGTLRHIRANTVVTHEGHSADHLYLLVKGRARFFYITEEGKKLILLWLTPGELFGGRTLLLTPSTYLVSTETVKDSWVIGWNRSTIRGLAMRYPRLLDNAILEASDYLASQLGTYVTLTTHNAKQRLLHLLTTLAPHIGREVPEGIELDVTNEELANAANITLFTASRLLSEMQRKGVLLKKRGKVVLRSPEQLLSQVA